MSRQMQAVAMAFGKPSRAQSTGGLSPGDVFTQIVFPMVLILSISVLLMAEQSQAVEDAANTVKRWDMVPGKKPLILEVYKQKLLRRVNHVCAEREKNWKLSLFPWFDRVQCQGAFPSDPDFKTLCTKARSGLGDMSQLLHSIYAAALECTAVDDAERMYDPVVFPGSAPQALSFAPNFIGDDQRGKELREFAFKLIRGRCDTWREQVKKLQLAAVEHTLLNLDTGNLIDDPDRNQIKANLREKYKELEYPLLPGLL